jgi:hypothetical protein
MHAQTFHLDEALMRDQFSPVMGRHGWRSMQCPAQKRLPRPTTGEPVSSCIRCCLGGGNALGRKVGS